jgi:ADP-ribose pyrophosphatase YjhB (NUDIX family)
VSGPIIKVKAMGLFVADGRLLVMPCHDSVKGKSFFRLLGGHVEFGETAEDTLKREMREELGAEIAVHGRLAVIEGVFDYLGRRQHEVTFIHHASFLDPAFHRRDDLYNLELNEEIFRWIPVAEALGGPAPLYPTADYRGFLAQIAAG